MADGIRNLRLGEYDAFMRFLERCYGFSPGMFEAGFPHTYRPTEELCAASYVMERGGRIVSHVGLYPLEVVVHGVVASPGWIGDETLDPKLRKQVDIISSEIQRSDKIIMDLLGYSKLASGKIDRVNVNAALDEALEDLKNEIGSRRIVIAKAYARHLPRLLIDRTQFRTMMSNLLLNACEAIDSLGKITVGTDYSDDGFIEVSIADTGKGIPEENLPKVFDSFFTTKTTGSGLGLSIVNSIAQAYGGTVSVESRLDKGSCVTARLPTRTARAKQ